ncbi:uncharacterized protein LOC127354738 [Dicentrarchus labrax]|uniref:uncharacterized protein LOC127354738 n=1 Tax=Dicentrarchus labrax TaxID=13489 RepID=UPI0021F57E24|nr:uncharacterized protein LOC127354738 [Dicentrarchus labrax]
MKILVVFLLAALSCSLSEGRIVSKCELKDALMTAIGQLPEKAKQRGLTVDKLVAKIVCHVEFASGFNTSAVDLLTSCTDDHHGRKKRGVYGGLFSMAEPEDPTVQPHTRQQRSAEDSSHERQPKPPRSNRPSSQDGDVCTLYGLFQLSSHLVCSDGSPSPNICGMDCSELTDDNIQDDISCVLKIFTYFIDNGFGAPHFKALTQMIRLIYQEECRDVKASDYFTDCTLEV